VKLTDKIKKFPAKAGVYLFKNEKGEVLYVGKAKSLRRRVSSYFKPQKEKGTKVEFILKRASDIDFIVTDNEKEALLLENSLIKKYKPRYNIQLRDDKTYVSIRLGLEHPFPGMSFVRRVLKDGAAYFGPYTSSAAARSTADHVIRSFRIRSCTDREFSNRVRPCLEFDLGRCSAPCAGRISEKDYHGCVDDALLFLKGAKKELLNRLNFKMQEASGSMRYEEASRIRDLINQIKETLVKQKVVVHGGEDKDAVGFVREGDKAAVCILVVRGGVLLDRRLRTISSFYGDNNDILESFLLEHYSEGSEIPKKIVLSDRIEGQKAVESILIDRRGGKVSLVFPLRGPDKDMAHLAVQNAEEILKARIKEGTQIDETMLKLQKKLKLTRPPETIECLDITNLMGRGAYGSLVVFVRGEPEKTRYRLYGIKTLAAPDDYAMMREVLARRFGSFLSLRALAKQSRGIATALSGPRNDVHREPDLLLIDGGKGQLNTARRVLDDLGFSNIPVASIAKASKTEKAEKKEDKIFVIGRKNPVNMKSNSQELLLLKRIRDEAHRFGIKTHRKRRIRDLFQMSKV
jgi:excinuclease ABC subunit C